MKLLSEALGEVLALVGKATPGPWRWAENGNIMAPGIRDVDEIAAVYTERDDDLAPANAEAIIAAVNFLRTYGNDIAAMLRILGDAITMSRATELMTYQPRPDGRHEITYSDGTRFYTIDGGATWVPLDAAGSAEGVGGG